ncbi:protein NO VEIN domain-containing protein [Acinetobacter sp. ANC 3832]|uniref:protein NO VEIN domain-containing protein n=1 Tax=Acinetobacter sp. ANC 3832 TaxID=1977874 RepID=UPI000A33165A|nr:DUF3883 domain-containing protein [Acinetobacter sp. ANC 3832]OTG86897.1 hypothetical protein B9T35_17945 [Acinetobacter sp. ANC 3832]
MYEVPKKFYQRLHHPRPRFKKNIENVLGYMSFAIVELDGQKKDIFKENISKAIKDYPGNANAALDTVSNWRTEITALFSMMKNYDDHVIATNLCKDLADTANLREFFLRFISTFQHPGGFLKNYKIKEIIDANIVFRPLLWLSNFLTSSITEENLYITDVEFCHCVLNDLRVTRDHEDVSLTIGRILTNREYKVAYDAKGDTKRYSQDILDYCVLAGLMLKDYEGKYFFREDAREFLTYFKDHAPLFTNYQKEQSLQEIGALRPLWIDFVNDSSKAVLLSFEKEISKKSHITSDALAFSTKQIGDEGEALTLAHEKIWLIKNGLPKLADLVSHMPTRFAVGYDVLSRELDATMRHIEVKTTVSQKNFTVNRIHLTPNEWSAAESHRDRYFIYRLQLSDESCSLWIIQDPVGLYKQDRIRMVPRNGADIFFDESCYTQVELLRTHE